MSEKITPEVVEAFFFEAMMHGYATEVEPFLNIPLPGWKTISYENESLQLVDMWHTTPNSDYSSGVITIFRKDMPIWVMHFGGWYKKSAIQFLKNALMHSFENRKFTGGRGPFSLESEGLTYKNIVILNSFVEFYGHEKITSETDGFLGTHWYRGMWLADPTLAIG